MTGENFIYSDWESMCALTVETRIEEIFAGFIRIFFFFLLSTTLNIERLKRYFAKILRSFVVIFREKKNQNLFYSLIPISQSLLFHHSEKIRQSFIESFCFRQSIEMILYKRSFVALL